jgi:hypothetical protein
VYACVTEGEVDFYARHYAPVRLAAGDSICFDSGMAHVRGRERGLLPGAVAVLGPPDTFAATAGHPKSGDQINNSLAVLRA